VTRKNAAGVWRILSYWRVHLSKYVLLDWIHSSMNHLTHWKPDSLIRIIIGRLHGSPGVASRFWTGTKGIHANLKCTKSLDFHHYSWVKNSLLYEIFVVEESRWRYL
jgi:hypothetical protein